jgi:hypothetical protein
VRDAADDERDDREPAHQYTPSIIKRSDL